MYAAVSQDVQPSEPLAQYHLPFAPTVPVPEKARDDLLTPESLQYEVEALRSATNNFHKKTRSAKVDLGASTGYVKYFITCDS